MNCLFVRAPFAGWIVDGVKLIEYRTRETLIRGGIGIIESGSGTVIGDAKLTNCIFDHQFKHYGWEISNPRRYANPVPFEHKQGCITWAILDYDPDAQEIAPPMSLRRHCSEVQKYNVAMEEWKRNRWRTKR